MIRLKSPSLVVTQISPYHRRIYDGDIDLEINNPLENPSDIITNIHNTYLNSSFGSQGDLVIDCYGFPSNLRLGLGFDLSNVILFRGIRNLFRHIYIFADDVGRNSNGEKFCSRIARNTHSRVIATASTQLFVNRINLGHNIINNFQGRHFKSFP